MSQTLLTIWLLILPHLQTVAWFVAYLIFVQLMARRTQIEAWVAKHPNWALFLRLWRSAGPDPVLAGNAIKEFLAEKAKLKEMQQ